MKTTPVLFAISMFLLTGCASVSVVDHSVRTSGAALKKPQRIYVQQFDITKGTWNVDKAGTELEEFKKTAAQELQRMMMERFPEIAPTEAAPAQLPQSGLLVAGEFVRVNQGSRALRMGVGFGAGGTKVETMVRLYDLSVSKTKPVMKFATTGGSNAEPGFLAGGVVSAASNSTGLQTDWERTSREIRNLILERFK